ncbi:MAG: molecular chaperone HtpG, partial [Erysipelotrichaceae bacterium]|nr:molecular chaperone HtpG [Erysipelotrichaceae bacterium]
MEKQQFKAESKRLLDLMIHSIYTNKEIFLRELISNASDALDKRHFLSLTNDEKRVNQEDLKITLSTNKDLRTFTIQDTGIGMTKEELENHLGTIAKSGSFDFKQENKDAEDIDIIGQFGVGFYSAFMVASKIVVESLSANDSQGYRWTSEGADGYTIEPIDRTEIGTTITLYLRDNEEEENYDEYLDTYKIKSLITKYSDYVRYPIQMMVEVSRPVEGKEDEYTTELELQTLNSMVPLWKRNKKDITEEEYNNFYMNKFMDWEKPQKVLHYSIEGTLSYQALLFIPSKTPYNFYSQEYEPGLQLYSKSVFIMDHAKDLIPDYFRFVKGLVDSDDVSLNISREILQQDRQLKIIARSIEKKIKSALVDMLVKEREEYESFYKNFGLQLKYGLYSDYGAHKEQLQDLILFYSSHEDRYVTLKEYVERMKENQDVIYYVSGDSIESIKKLPQMERVTEKGYEVLYFLDDVDEFAIRMLQTYMGKSFKSINQGELDLDTEEEKAEKETLKKENASLLEALKDALKDKVKDVTISSRLASHPVCLISDEGVSFE